MTLRRIPIADIRRELARRAAICKAEPWVKGGPRRKRRRAKR